jgi:PD-(D/E)XK nuclease superfamily
VTVIKVSNSELQQFRACRRQWWLRYYRGMMPKNKDYTGPLALGTRLHGALEHYYADNVPLLVAHANLVEIDRVKLELEGRDTDALNTEAELGRIMLEGYLEWAEEEGIDVELEFVSAEERISAPLFGGAVELQGKLYQRVRRRIDGVRMFRDWKSVGGSLTDYANLLQMNEQVLTYMLLEMLKEGEENRSEGGFFTLLRKVKRTAAAKPPFYSQVEVRHNIFTMRAFWDRIHGTITDLMRVRTALDAGVTHQTVAYPTPTRDCKWRCQFYSICTMFDDGSSAEQALDDLFEVGDPYGYYGDAKGSDE